MVQSVRTFLSLAFLLTGPGFIAGAETEFTYFFGGDEWKTAFSDCGKTNQSPINIVTASTNNAGSSSNNFLVQLRTNLKNISFTIGHAVTTTGQFSTVTTPSSLAVSSSWTNKNFHVHAPAEHTINGVQGDAEVHFVHQISGSSNSTYQYVVIGIIFKQTAGNPINFFNNWSIRANGTTVSFNMSQAFTTELLKNNGFYTYFGSFTTPPCTETVKFFILDTMQDISAAQLKVLNDLFKNNVAFANGKGNNRNVQPLNGRVVTYQTISAASVGPGITVIDAGLRILKVVSIVMGMMWLI